MRVLILAPYPYQKAPNQRFRFEQYLDKLQSEGIDYEYHPFWSVDVWEIFYQSGHIMKKTTGLLRGVFRRFALLARVRNFDCVFIHREAMPIGPPIIEYILANVLSKKIIYDFDDAIWIRNYSAANKGIARFSKFHRKVRAICNYSWKISVGNSFLAEFASQFNNQVRIIPTTIDTERHHNRLKEHSEKSKLTIGWTGSHSTLIHLREIEALLSRLQEKTDFELHVICNADPKFRLVKYQYVPWNMESEIEDLMKFDIGIMPLRNTDWERGKCGFKALQYMALGIPVVATAVGANKQIVQHNKSGILIDPEKPEDWIPILDKLLHNISLRKSFGIAGRQIVEDRFSVRANVSNYLALFETANASKKEKLA